MAGRSGAAVWRAIGLLAAAVIGVAAWQGYESRVEQRAYAAQAGPEMAQTQAAPVITPDTVSPPAPRHLYPEISAARGDIAMALKKAKAEHKRVILDFGGDWCPDCQVLDIYFHQSPNAQLLAENYVKVNVNIGRMDQNIEVAAQYGVPIAKGVPALAVLEADGKPVYAQASGEFNSMRRMQSNSVTEFLTKWKPRRA